MWNKQKGNRISRLVADLQTNPNRGNDSLVLETGFPTSIADFFLKNHDKMKKSSKKKHRSKLQPIPSSPSSPTFVYDLPFQRSVSDSPVSLSKFDMPTCSFDVDNKEFVAHKSNSDLSRRNPRVESNGYGCNYEYGMDDYGDNWRVSNSKKSSFWLLVLKGVVVVVVALYTRSFVLGVSIGAFLFCILEYLGKSIFGFFKPCEDARRKLRGFPPNLGVCRTRRGVDHKRNGKKARESVLKGAIDVGMKREEDLGGNGVVSTRAIEPKVESIKRGIEYEVRNDLVSRWGVEPEDIDGFSSKGELEQGNVASTVHKGNSYKLEEEFRRRPVFEIEVVEPYSSESNCASPRPFEIRGAKGVEEIGEEGSEGFEMVDHNGKVKKGKKKFWKKFVPKQSKKKKHKHRKGQDQASGGIEVPLDLIEEISLVSEEGNEQEDEEEMIGEGATSSSFSLPSLDEQERGGVEHNTGVVNHSNTGMLYTDECTKSSRMMKKKGKNNLRSLGFLGVVLAGLMGGRVFALVLTVICCLMLKMVRG